MRPIAAFSVLVASQAVAAPWSDWVGDFRGALTWRQCSTTGEKTATISLDAVDGALRIDLAGAGAALRSYSLVQEDNAWTAQDGDVRVHVSKKKQAIELAIDLDSGCSVRGSLARATTSVPACDGLVAWSRIEARCTKADTKLEDFAALSKMKWKKSDSAKCTTRSEALALAMVSAGCAPHPDPNIGTRAIECRSLVDATQKLTRCGRVPREVAQYMSNIGNALDAASQTAEPSTLPYVEKQCKDVRIEVAAVAVRFQCAL